MIVRPFSIPNHLTFGMPGTAIYFMISYFMMLRHSLLAYLFVYILPPFFDKIFVNSLDSYKS